MRFPKSSREGKKEEKNTYLQGGILISKGCFHEIDA